MPIQTNLSAESGLLEVTLDLPPSNLLTLTHLHSLRDIFASAGEKNSKVKCIQVKSAVSHLFSQGLDPAELLGVPVSQRIEHFIALAELTISALQAGRPTLCVVEGPAIAGGAVLAALANYRYFQAEHGKFCFSETKVFLPVPRFVHSLVSRFLNPSHLFEALCLAKNYDAASSLACGFANEIFESKEDLNSKLKNMTAKILRLDPSILQETLRQGNREAISAAQQFLENSQSLEVFLGDDFFGKGLRSIMNPSLR